MIPARILETVFRGHVGMLLHLVFFFFIYIGSVGFAYLLRSSFVTPGAYENNFFTSDKVLSVSDKYPNQRKVDLVQTKQNGYT